MHIVKTITKKHSLIVRLLALALALACTVPLLSQTVFAKNTYVITDGDQVTVHTTYETNPEIVLDEAGLQLSDVNVFETQAKDGVSEITGRRGMTVTVYSGGEVMQIISYGETVQEMVDRMGIPLVEESIVSVPMDTMTYDGMEILIQTTLTSTDSYTVVIPFETEYQQTGLLDKGVEVILTAGVDGQKRCTAEVTYIDGEEASRELLTEEVVSEPVTQVVAVGTGKGGGSKKPIIGDGVIITGSGDVLTYTRRDTFKATAYCRTDEGGEYTSTGTRTRVGAIAVDPRVIPYGTRMFIVTKDGSYIYGVATAEDCGGAIKGKRLDLFYETDPECRRFGIRNCDVYFLG
jgi:uncharacterized protein YabE (DUF348 family)/3D (Asp-Asp-Asp) domain-containing protein